MLTFKSRPYIVFLNQQIKELEGGKEIDAKLNDME
jgi:hypothetical protein